MLALTDLDDFPNGLLGRCVFTTTTSNDYYVLKRLGRDNYELARQVACSVLAAFKASSLLGNGNV
jgi:hypothetical protein